MQNKMQESEDSRSLKYRVQKIVQSLVHILLVHILQRCLSMKEYEKTAGEVRRHVIEATEEAIAIGEIDLRKKLDKNEIPKPHDHDPSPSPPPISPSISPTGSEISYDSTSSESIPCVSPQQATTWFDDEGHSAREGETSKNVTCDSAEMREPAKDEVTLFEQNLSPKVCTSPPAPPENGSGDTADTAESIADRLLRRQLTTTGTATTVIISEQDSNRHAVASQSQCTSSQTSLNGDEVHTPVKERLQTPVKRLPMKVKYANDHAVNYDSKHSPLIHNNRLHSMVRNDMLRTYNLLDSKERGQEIHLTNKHIHCAATYYKVFYFFNKLSLLTGGVEYKTWKLNLYHLVLDAKPATSASWEPVPFSRFSISQSLFDLDNCIPVSHREDGVIVVSILNDLAKQTHCIVFHIFSQKTSGKNWKTASSLLPIQFTGTVEYRIQSCKIDPESKYIYCSLLQHEVGAYIYKFDLMLLQQHRKSNKESIKPACSWHIEEPTIQHCSLSLLREEIIMISFNYVNDKNIMQVKRSENFSAAAPAEYQFEFSYEVTIIAASIISNSKIVVIYQDNKTKQYRIKTFTIAN